MIKQETIEKYVGKVFGHWTVLEYADHRRGGARFLCRCVCGTERPVLVKCLNSGHSKSCGCRANRSRLSEKFWPRVDMSGECWLWTGYLSRGYGLLGHDGRHLRSHRASWIIHFGEIPDGLFVLHTCDNKKCVRPEHLFLGTHADNMRDKAIKGRCAKVVRKLDADKVRDICNRHLRGESQAAISRRYDIHEATVNGIVHRRSWSNVE